MYTIDNGTLEINLSRGDNMVIPIIFRGFTFSVDDRVIFTVKEEVTSRRAFVRKELIVSNDTVTLTLSPEESASIPLGHHYWDLRIVVNPEYDEQGCIVSGSSVITPITPKHINIREVVGDVCACHCN